MRRTKTERYQDILAFPNVTHLKHYEFGNPANIKGKWHTVFDNHNPITLELACGKGEYSIGLATSHPNRNFIGIDIKGDRIWKGATKALEKGLTNVHFLRSHIDHITNYFAPDEINEIWIPFPDPYLKKSKKQKRLTHPLFLKRYSEILQTGGWIHLKTDSDTFFEFTNEVIRLYRLPVKERISNLYANKSLSEALNIETFYEKKHLASGKSIKYICFGLNDKLSEDVLAEIDDLQ